MSVATIARQLELQADSLARQALILRDHTPNAATHLESAARNVSAAIEALRERGDYSAADDRHT